MLELFDDLPAALCEGLHEAPGLLMAKGIVLADGNDPAVALFEAPIRKGTRHLAGGKAGNAHDIRDALSLREIVGCNDGHEIWSAGTLHEFRNGQTCISEYVADQHVHVALLHQPARFLQSDVGHGTIVLDGHFHLAIGNRASQKSRD